MLLGLTFKENCPDTRNSKVNDIIKHLNRFEIEPKVVDPWASENDALSEYGITLTKIEEVKDVDCLIIAVAHEEFKKMTLNKIKSLLRNKQESVIIDVKGLYEIKDLKSLGVQWWRL